MGWQGSWAPELCRGQTEGCSVNWTVVVKNKKTIHGELLGTLPLEREQTPFAASPPWCSAGECTLLCVHGGGGKVSPLPQRCTLPAHEEATLFVIVPLTVAVAIVITVAVFIAVAIAVANSVAVAVAVAIAVAIAISVVIPHCRHHLCRPLPLRLPSTITAAISVSHCLCHCPCCWPLLSPSPLAITVAISVGHQHRRCRQPLPRLLPWRDKNCIWTI
jgi:hypothetical protein